MKEFFLKKMIKSQAPNLKDADVEKMLEVFSEHPDLFKKIAEEIKTKTAEGETQMSATFEVMNKYRSELENLKKD